MYTSTMPLRAAFASILIAGTLLATGCGDDAAEADVTTTKPTTIPPATAPATTEPEVTAPPASEAPDDEVPATEAPPAEPVTTEAPEPAVVEVHAADYGFGGLPEAITAGTELRLVNDSSVEVHEIVAVRLPDTETRSVHDMVHANDLGALFAGGDPALVIVAGPSGAEQIVAVGDGTLTEPGRYAVFCFIPTGADPEEYFALLGTTDGPPPVEGGAPHLMNGMFDEVVVTA